MRVERYGFLHGSSLPSPLPLPGPPPLPLPFEPSGGRQGLKKSGTHGVGSGGASGHFLLGGVPLLPQLWPNG